nr:toolbox 10 expression cassette [synthetic construct]
MKVLWAALLVTFLAGCQAKVEGRDPNSSSVDKLAAALE